MQHPHDHFDQPEILAIAAGDPLAVLLDLRVRTWASHQATGGRVSAAVPRMLAGTVGVTNPDQLVSLLETSGLWMTVEGGGWLLSDHEQIVERERRLVENRAAAMRRQQRVRGGKPSVLHNEQLPLVAAGPGEETHTTRSTAVPSPVTRDIVECHATDEDEDEEQLSPLPPPGEDGQGDPALVDDVFAALLDVEHRSWSGPLPASSDRRIRRAARQLAAAGGTADQVRAAGNAHRQLWPALVPSAASIARHWPSLTAPPPDTTSSTEDRTDRDRRAALNLAQNWAHLDVDDLVMALHSRGLDNHVTEALAEYERVRSAA
jgi:hypothetical protein